jgi:hypothetical protein
MSNFLDDMAAAERAEQLAARKVGGRPAKDYAARGNVRISCDGCGFHCRASLLQLRRAMPLCGCGYGALTVCNFRDRLALDEDGALSELGAMAPGAAAELLRSERLRVAEFRDYFRGAEQREQRRVSRGGAAQQRCSYDGPGGCVRFASRGGLCAEHYADAHAGSSRGRAHAGVDLREIS